MSTIHLIGCGFVADLYMGSLQAFPDISVGGVYDRDADRMAAFAAHWKVPAAETLEALLAQAGPGAVILNLTNPGSHYEVSRSCLEAGCHVYSEKPLAMDMDHARALHSLAGDRGLMLASAPCSVLGEAAQTLAHAVRSGVAGVPRLVYAELDDDFVPQAPYKKWIGESGPPWPYEDEFRVGCTLEHAGYYLTWLIAMFGPVRRVISASAETIPDKVAGADGMAPDYASATLFFANGPVTRLTCSIVAPHDHRLRMFCDKGVLEMPAAWNNNAKVKFRRRFTIRRRLITHPIGTRIRLKGPTHPKVGRTGAASMNFMLGPAEMLAARDENRPCRLSADFALHLNEVTLAIQSAGDGTGMQEMTTRCDPMEPMPWAV